MAKLKTAFYCQQCGYESAKWLGKCPGCHSWNTFAEEIITKDNISTASQTWKTNAKEIKTISISKVTTGDTPRWFTADAELNRVLGGGIVPGSITLVA